MPTFSGGDEKLREFLSKTMRYPSMARENETMGTVIIGFVVEADGKLSAIEVKSAVDQYLDAEALRVVNAMPKWESGEQNGEKVPVYVTVPIKFILK